MLNKNINITNIDQTLTPIYYIDDYQETIIKEIFNTYKFKNTINISYLSDMCLDICISILSDNIEQYIVFTHPPSTMYYRKEKNTDSMGDLILNTKKNLSFYFKSNLNNYCFKKIFSINKKYLKNKKAQHLSNNRESRTKNLDKRYYLNFWNKRFLKKISKKFNLVICIIDDVSSTGGTLLACKNCLKNIKVDIKLYSLAH